MSTSSSTELSPASRPGDAAGLLIAFAIVLFAIPAQLLVKPLNESIGSPANLFGLLLFVYWAVTRTNKEGHFAVGYQPVKLALGLFAVGILLAYIAGVLRPLPGDESHAADVGLLHLVAWSGMALAACDLLRTKANVDRLLRTVVIMTGCLAVLGVIQFTLGIDIAGLFRFPLLHEQGVIGNITARSDFRRVSGTASHPIEFGMVLATVLPLAIHYASLAQRRKPVWWGMVLMIGMGIPMSLSRSAILGVVAGMLVVFPTWSRQRKFRALLITPVFAIGMKLVVPGLLGTVKSLFINLGNDPSVQGRTDDYAVIGRFIDQSPWIGRGFGTFLPTKYITLDNQYLGMIVEAGFVGLACLLLLFALTFFTARGVRLRSASEETRGLAQCLAAAMFSTAVGFATFDGLGFPMVSGLLFLLAGCIGALWRIQVQRGDLAPETHGNVDAPRAVDVASPR